MKIKEYLSNSIGYVIPILLALLWINGCGHVQKKHDVDPFSASFFVCWYYGLEKFWHKTDQAELNENIKVAIYILMKYPNGIDPGEQIEFNKLKSEFKDLLKHYEKDEIEYIGEGTMAYLRFKNEIEVESLKSIEAAKDKGVFEFKLTHAMDSLMSILSTYGLADELSGMISEIENISNEGNRVLKENPNFINEIQSQNPNANIEVEQSIKNRLKIYSELFI